MNKGLSYMFMLIIGLALVVGASTTVLGEDFFKDKTIHFVVGYSPGGGYDTYTRVIARHFGKHVPGSPVTVVQNRTGAGSLIAANYMYNRAKPNGLTIGIWNSVFVLYQALGDEKVKLDYRKFGWLGAPSKGSPTCAVMAFTGLKTFDDILKSKTLVKMGASGGSTLDIPRILNKTLVRPVFNVIPGYRGTSTIRLAMQSKELDGVCFEWESMRVTARSMLDAKGDGKLIPFLTQTPLAEPEVKGLPLISEVIKGEENLATFNAWAVTREFMRPFALPPGVPKERLEILQKAFKATLEDPEFLAETKKSNLLIEYVSPQEIHRGVNKILSTPPKSKENLLFLIRKKKS